MDSSSKLHKEQIVGIASFRSWRTLFKGRALTYNFQRKIITCWGKGKLYSTFQGKSNQGKRVAIL